MKKSIISVCAAALLAASVGGYAGSITLENRYNQPVQFTVSNGDVYNPVFEGILLPGHKTTVKTSGPVRPGTYFMAYAPYSASNVVTNCGSLMWPVDNLVVRAGRSVDTGLFGGAMLGCYVAAVSPSYGYKHHCEHKKQCCHKKHYCNVKKQQQTNVKEQQ